MIIFPLQSFGVGDVIFTQSLVRKIANGNKVLWGVESHFVDGLNRAYDGITFIDKKLINVDYNRRDDYVINGMRVLPIRWSDANLKVPYNQCMRAKYDAYNEDWRTWKEHAMWNRDKEMETKLGIKNGIWENDYDRDFGEYNLVNTIFGSESQLQVPIEVNNGLLNIQMKTIEGFSLFDWAGIIEQANEIHTVSTSIIYLLELLDLKAKEVHLYTRKPIEPTFDNISYILEKHNYILHQ